MGLISFIRETVTDAIGIATSKQRIRGLFQDSLYRNSIYLMLNSAVLALTGFLFWAVAARLYPVEGIGLASATISAMTLLALLSTLGLDYGLIRFLPNSRARPADIINSCFTVSGLVSIALALVFLAGLGVWSSALLFIRQDCIFSIAFVVFVLASTLHNFVHRAFIAMRRAEFALAAGLIFGLVRFMPLVVLAALFHTFGIFASWGVAMSLVVIISTLVFFVRIQPGYRPLPTVDKAALAPMMRFSFANYGATLLWAIPGLVLPLMVVNLLGAESNAYFYIGWATAGILLTVPIATSFSLFAEGSHDEEKLAGDVRRSLKLILVILVPAIILIFLLGDRLLLLFGTAYSENATQLLWVLAASALPVSVNHIYFSIKRVQVRMKSVVGLNAFIAVFALALSWFLLPRIGILGAGVAWLSANGLVTPIVVPMLIKGAKQVKEGKQI